MTFPGGRAPGGFRLAGALLSGFLVAQAFPGIDLGALAWVGVVPLLLALHGASPGQGALLGAVQGGALFATMLYWIPAVMANYGGLPWVVAVPVGGILVAVLALFHATFGLVMAWLLGRLGPAALVCAPAAWVFLCEWMRVWPVGGFPWGFIGYTQHRNLPVLQLASGIGVYGVGGLLLAVNAALAASLLALRRQRFPAAVALGLLTVSLVVGSHVAGWSRLAALERSADDAQVPVAAVQGNVAQDIKWQEKHRARILERHIDLTERAAAGGARLIVWPESSTQEQLGQSAALQRRLAEIARRYGSALVVGSIFRLPEGGYTNAAFLMDGNGSLVDRYDKARLVPFGETVPLRRLLFFVGPLVQAVGDFRPGKGGRAIGRDLHLAGDSAGATPLAVAICYEIIFPELVAEQVRAGATLLVTITNDAWFGRSWAASQHFAMAAFRAAETRRWLVRAANTGISGVVDPAGRVQAATPLFETRLVEQQVGVRRDLTWAVRHPHAVPLACVILLGLATPLALASRSRSHTEN